MAKYEVVRPWFGVKVGDVVELKELHPALKSNVRLMRGEAGGDLTPATPEAKSGRRRKNEEDE
ncbi:glycoprotein [Salmonella enterica]|nr:glycoprotein [Salmonella enterica]EBC7566937.1 glycoprotein [Salmonella enterica]ECA5067680.1 glycoprotein [Salmonella enterica subsp. enterica serovar Oranienburg]EJZ5223723.1 glycoprotein [Salmonella enterica]